MRIAAIDWGGKRVGIAISDERKKIAIHCTTIQGGVKEVAKYLISKDLELVLIGLPILLSGKEGEGAKAVKEFSKELESMLHIPIRLIDERFTSRAADQSLREMGLKRKERAKKMDETAALLILQEYLDQL